MVAILAPWIGFHSEKKGRKPLLLIGFGLEPLRAAISAVTSYYPFLVVAQVLDGITGAIIGVLTILVITDLTTGTGRFNLVVGLVAAMGGIAASISTSTTGYMFQVIGTRLGYVPLAVIAAAAAIMIWLFLFETKPEQYLD
jgi:MFS family permease